MSSRTDRHVVVVKGGHSVERQVSLVSGRECAAALRRVGYKVTEVDAGNDLPKELCKLSPDVVFNALHGRFGEDAVFKGCLSGWAYLILTLVFKLLLWRWISIQLKRFLGLKTYLLQMVFLLLPLKHFLRI